MTDPPGVPGVAGRRLFAIVNQSKLRRILTRMLDESEFLSSYGIRSLSRYHLDHPYTFDADGERFVECPAGSGRQMTLFEVAREIANRLSSIFVLDKEGRRPVFGGTRQFQSDLNWRDGVLFYEYFHGDNGAGIGASHQPVRMVNFDNSTPAAASDNMKIRTRST